MKNVNNKNATSTSGVMSISTPCRFGLILPIVFSLLGVVRDYFVFELRINSFDGVVGVGYFLMVDVDKERMPVVSE